jgi:hypothetical protein
MDTAQCALCAPESKPMEKTVYEVKKIIVFVDGNTILRG